MPILRTPSVPDMMPFYNIDTGDPAAFYGYASLGALPAVKLFQP
jgi:hypothetical protein